jgi:hypothetical protein
MSTHVANRILAGLAALVLAAPTLVLADDAGRSSWQNLGKLSAGQRIEVERTNGSVAAGAFVSFTDQSVSLHEKRRDIAVPRTEVARVRLRRAGARKCAWIGAGIGAGVGAGAGAGLGEGLANRSGGDFRNLKPAIIGASAGIGALVGALIGSGIGNRHSVIYAAR